ncbi:FAD binding domain-containing protein [Pseudonocardia xinjiangensis]|uniref:Molybdopterin dehydrogenase n=1 Tax=Pseudonocardia xinjiangensis TaxID=75289 RepID=A0ABX1RTF5_9PSEU|nr:FAD binding domain-containing protein [Pseudonocardia xinjiangensis]NMH82451.1 molybdopterin dehydrogenase [Pseudonocardia xinjiangensis]
MAAPLGAPTLHRPDTLDEVCALLGSLDQAMVYGGGTAVQILIKQGVLFASDLVDLSLVPDLDGIERTDTGLRVGAMVSLRRMETDPVVRRIVPLAAQVYGHVANPRVRNTASVGGNLAHGDYRLDPPTALMVLGARVELRSSAGVRHVPVRDFFVGFQETAVAPGELVTAVEIPAQTGSSSGFAKLSSQSVNDWPCASAAALVTSPVQGQRELRLGLGALAEVPKYVSVDVPSDAGVADAVRLGQEAAGPVIDPIPDIRGGADFKRRLGLVAVEDAIRAAWGSTGGTETGAAGRSTGKEGSDARRNSRRRWWRSR